MNTIGKNIKRQREQAGLTQSELAKRLGVTDKAVSTWELGTREPRMGLVEAMSVLFGVSKSLLMGWEDAPASRFVSDSLVPVDDQPSAVVSIPVFGSVPAGVPFEAIADIVDTEEIPALWCTGGKQYFGLRVRGDSMYPRYLDGDTVIVRKQGTCESGDDCVVYVNGYEATLKRVRIGEDGTLTLIPQNPNYPPVTYSPAEAAASPVSIAGVVVELRRKIVR